MKKRLLSAALALAMVLTLLPVSAFAATYAVGDGNPNAKSYTDAQGNSHFYFEKNTAGTAYNTVTVTYQASNDQLTGKEAGKWYWTDTKTTPGTTTYWAVTSGVVASVGTSGSWYPDLNSLISLSTGKLTSTSFTLLSADTLPTISDIKNQPTTLSVDVNGFALSGTLYDTVTNLTVTDKLHPLTTTGSIPGISRNTASRQNPVPPNTVYSNLTATLSNITVPSISLQGGVNSVTLNNVAVTGTILMDGETETETTSNGNKTTVYSKQTLTVNNNGLTNLSTSTTLGGAVTIEGDGSALILNNAIGGSAVSVTGNSGSITVNGYSNLGNITVASRSGATAVPPTVTVTAGTVGDITRTDNDSTQANTVTVSSGGTTGDISTSNGKVTVNQGKASDINVGAGTLTLTGPATTGTVTLPGTGKTTLSISGTGSKITGITAAGGNLTISAWPTGRDNNFGALNLGTYSARGVKGGTFTADFAAPANATWFDTNLQYVVTVGTNYALYGKTEIAQAISDVSSTTAGATVKMHILCQASTKTLELKNGSLTWAQIGYAQPTGMILPEEVNGYSIATWTSKDNTASVPSGKEEVIPLPSTGTAFALYANGVATTVVKSITKVAVSGNTVENQDVRVTMNGTNIQISGAVTPAPGSNIATIKLDLTTDALKDNGDDTTAGGGATVGSTGYLVLEGVQVFYNVDTKAVQFSSLQKLDGGAIVNANGELVLNNGTGTHYTVSASLSQSASNLEIHTAGKEVQATVSGTLASRSQTDKDQIIAQIAGTGAEFDINSNRAILEAINAAQATITSTNTVDSWVTTAQNYVWKNGNSYTNATTGQALTVGKGDGSLKPHTGTLSTTGNFAGDANTIRTNYQKAYLVPYLVVNATNMNQTGTMNATLTVYYRIDVSGATYSPTEYYTVKTGTPLGALSGDMATNPAKVKFATAFPYATAIQMHQDGKYVYAQTGGYWEITHAGTGNGSLGTIVLNATPGSITLTSDIATRAPSVPAAGWKYDNLQAAIDDTVPGIVTTTGASSSETLDTITIDGTYTGSCAVTMSGVARKIAVVSKGNHKVTSNTSGVDVQTLDGYNYTVQLKQDNVVAGTVALTVQGTIQGTASLSTSSAKVGETVTVTVQPVTGQTATGVSVKTNTGTTVNATSTGVANQYSFTVPTGVTSITVTPTFSGTTSANFAVNSSSRGTATAITGTADGRAQQGTTVPVAVSPNNGYRTVGLTARGNNGSTASVTRTGTNSFNVTVPVGATTVTVTPSFDVNTGTPFADVLSNHWASSSITWAYNNKYIEGTGAYSYSPSSYMTLGEVVAMLYKAAGSPPVTGMSNPYTNLTPNSHWAYNAIIWAANQRLISSSTGTINPWGYATRAEIVEILYRRANSPTVYGTSGFADVASNASYSKAVTWARQKGLTNGYGGNTYFRPGYAVSRAEMAAFLQRAFSNVG